MLNKCTEIIWKNDSSVNLEGLKWFLNKEGGASELPAQVSSLQIVIQP